ncbi:MAG TPA: hypothetical protein VKR56_15105 [Candidatus Cybelea sp.]|nr:hypothetical protein [Candidatus Cybelea sp.]
MSLYFGRSVLSLCAVAAILAGCGAMRQNGGALPVVVQAAPGGQSWMNPRATSGDLLYVSDTESSDVYVYSYPGDKLVGTLTGFKDPGGLCVDKNGNVFVTNTGGDDVVEYAHGGTSPIATLGDPGYFPFGCSIDPTTGNLGVANNFPSSGSGQGNVVIYTHAKGKPKGDYTDPNIEQMLLCGYDDKGNLFVDGLTKASGFAFAELRSGGTTLTNITLNQSIGNPGGVQWDGKHVAVGDQSTNVVYQFDVSGKKGTKAGSTALSGATEVVQFWIAGSKLIGPDAGEGNVGIWKYPAGGSEVKKITGLAVPLGATLSKESNP